MGDRQLFVFWQFGGNNKSYCNQVCPYCYGGEKENKFYFNGDVDKWEKAFERLDKEHGDKGIYFVFSYGESMGMKGFYECVEMIGKHPTWTLTMVTNFSFSVARLLNTRLAKEGRLMLHPCFHPLGFRDGDRAAGWFIFKEHLLQAKEAGVPMHVLYLFYKPQIDLFPEYFDWLYANNIRVSVRRFVGHIGGYKLPLIGYVGGKDYPKDYSRNERLFIESSTSGKVIKYGVDLVPPTGKLCLASKDMILVKYNGDVAPCADQEHKCIGNIFDLSFHLSTVPVKCEAGICGGDYGMLHILDPAFPPNIDKLPNQPFLSIAEGISDGTPVEYKNIAGMRRALDEIKRKR